MCVILMCKRHHYNITKATFYDDTDHYKHTHKNKSEIMENFQKFHEKNGEKIHRFHGKKRSIPYAYTLLKFKDISRTRPIVSYFKHPLKETYNFASRALAHVIKMAQTNNFTLWKCQDMKQRIQKAQQDLTSQFNNTTKIMPLCADIKNMYTELPHEEILKSIKFMLRRCQQKTRRKHVTLERKKRGEIHLGKTNAVTSTTHVTLSFDKIYDICKYDILKTHILNLLEHCYTRPEEFPWGHLDHQATQYVYAHTMSTSFTKN